MLRMYFPHFLIFAIFLRQYYLKICLNSSISSSLCHRVFTFLWYIYITCRPCNLFCPIAVRIHAAKQAYPTNTDITFLAVADVMKPVEFLWYFGDSKSTRTTSKTVTKRYYAPGRYTQKQISDILCSCYFKTLKLCYGNVTQ